MKKISGFLISLFLIMMLTPTIIVGAQKPTLQTSKKSICIAETFVIKINNLPKGSTVTYSSNKKSIATVSKKGIVTGVTAGSCKINTKIKNGSKTYNLILNITVKKPAFATKNTDLTVGSTAALKISNKPKKGATYTWSSSDNKIVSVKNGTIKCIKAGTATITVKIKTSKKTYTSSNTVTVSKKQKTESDYLNYLSNVSKKHTGTDGDLDSEGAYEDVIKIAKQGIQDGIIQDYDKQDDGVSIKFSSGIKFIYQKDSPELDASGSAERVDIWTLQPFLSSYSSSDRNRSSKATDTVALNIADKFSNYRFYKNYDNSEVTVNSMKSLTKNELIIFHSHGYYESGCGSILWLGEKAGNSDLRPGGARYDDLINERLVLTEDYLFGITAAFVSKYCGNMNNTFLYLGSCSSGQDSRLAYSFINKGASAVIANSETIYRGYNLSMMQDVFSNLLKKNPNDGNYNTLETALKDAKNKNGNNDYEWFKKTYGDESDHTPATPKIFGNKQYRLYNESNTIVQPTGINLSQINFYLTEGDTGYLYATVSPSNATDKSVTWSSGNTSVASVNNGAVKAVGEGSTYIYAKTSNGFSASCYVSVSKKTVSPTGISLNQSNMSLTEGDTGYLSATVSPSNATNKTVSWRSGNTSVATVNGGTVRAVSEGSTYIYAETSNGYSASCYVSVSKKTVSPTGISLNQSNMSLTEGDTGYLSATVSPSNATNKTVSWSSDNTSVATVNNGTVKAVGVGSTYIYAKTSNGYSASCFVNVSGQSVLDKYRAYAEGTIRSSIMTDEERTKLSFAVVDLDNNNIPDLCWSGEDPAYPGSGIFVLTHLNGQLLNIRTNKCSYIGFIPTFYYYPKKGVTVADTDTQITYNKLFTEDSVLIFYVSGYKGNVAENIRYSRYIRSENTNVHITENEYNDAIANITGNAQRASFSWHANTETNRNSYLR